MIEEHKLNKHTKRGNSFLRFCIPFISIFFGVIYWLEGFKYFIQPEDVWHFSSGFILKIYWAIVLSFLFIRFSNLNYMSKIFIILIAISVSFNFYIMLMYNHFTVVCFGFGYMLSSKDLLLIRLGSYMSILGVELIVLAIIAPDAQTNLNYLTNISRIKDKEMKKKYKFLEIWASFPVFMGVHNIFFLFFVLNDEFRCLKMPVNFALILALPWLILMVFHIIYSSVVGLRKIG